jgi:phospholipid transport system substrate-binding protein
MLHRLKSLIVALALVALAPALAQAAVEDAKHVVEGYYATLLGVMHKGRELGYKGRYETLKPAVDKSFNLALMAQATVGSFWESMTADQRAALVKSFEDFTVANYANHFDDFGGQKLEIYGAEETPRKDVIVDSAIVKSDGSKVKIDYLLRPEDGSYKIIDVFVDGAISELATRRSEYTSVIRRDGVDALIKLIRDKADGLSEKQ